MLIANPIYDTVFKYLMDDVRVARIIISTIIGEEVEELVFKQRERSAQIVSLGVSIFRLDFSAVVKTAEGPRRNVLIEIQKADSGDDLPRFRRYLAENYYSPGHKPDGATGELIQDQEAPLIPIITIYILGFALENLKGHSAVIVRRGYFDAVTGDAIRERADFIENLTHDSYVIQISELKQRRRNRLEQLLSLFEQMNLQTNRHLKEFSDQLPEEFQSVQDRLFRAALDTDIRAQMEVEDEYLAHWKRRDRTYDQALKEERRLREEERRLREEAQQREEEANKRVEEANKRTEEILAEKLALKRKLEALGQP